MPGKDDDKWQQDPALHMLWHIACWHEWHVA